MIPQDKTPEVVAGGSIVLGAIEAAAVRWPELQFVAPILGGVAACIMAIDRLFAHQHDQWRERMSSKCPHCRHKERDGP